MRRRLRPCPSRATYGSPLVALGAFLVAALAAPGPAAASTVRKIAVASSGRSKAPSTERGLVEAFSDPGAGLHSEVEAEKLRALERLGGATSERDRQLLVRTVDATAGNESARFRLTAARALARQLDRPSARRSLGRLLSTAAGSTDPLDTVVRGTIALALARSGAPDAIGILARALRQSVPLAEAARTGLVAYPPERIAIVLEAGPIDLPVIELLDDLGDQRAFAPLREVVRGARPKLRARAALSLYRLGALETVELAEFWWKNSQDPDERNAAAMILTDAGSSLAPGAIATLLSSTTGRAAREHELGIELAQRAPHESFEEPLRRLAESDEPVRDRALTALSRLTTPSTLDYFRKGLTGAEVARSAGALARGGTPESDSLLLDALKQPAARAWALRALTVRAFHHPASPWESTALEAARSLVAPGAPEIDRAAGAWALAALSPEEAVPLLERGDAVVATAAARQSFDGPLARAAAGRLANLVSSPNRAGSTNSSKSSDLALENALSAALWSPRANSELSTQTLRQLPIEPTSGANAALASALSARLPSPPRTDLERTSSLVPNEIASRLDSSQARLRAATAWGLGRASTPQAVGFLRQAYDAEPSPMVRRAVVLALGAHSGRGSRLTLIQAQALDPDAATRALAGALLSTPPGSGPGALSSRSLLWRTGVAGPAAVTSAWGQTLPLHPDPDGFMGVLGFGPDPLDLVQEEPRVLAPKGEQREPAPGTPQP